MKNFKKIIRVNVTEHEGTIIIGFIAGERIVPLEDSIPQLKGKTITLPKYCGIYSTSLN